MYELAFFSCKAVENKNECRTYGVAVPRLTVALGTSLIDYSHTFDLRMIKNQMATAWASMNTALELNPTTLT